ncbi:Pentatricopeptide repeat-containing protein [Apostasia shenzhenica]|uniref:Pentatricopeptide repeat-containing protein n=1 Tax=Apostasia shenzhenica TaxID=1088818 RepID=A0A2I0A9C6_9ASPA|nr:Pentatricopeptide repeat-containing protein [Apostasia shenzhenica]
MYQYGPGTSPPLLTPQKCIFLLRSFTHRRSLRSGEQLHAFLISSGLLHSHRRHPLLLPTLAAMYSLCRRPTHAHQLFDEIPHKTAFLFNVLIRSNVEVGLPRYSLLLFLRMLSSNCRPDNFTFPFVLKACSDLSLLRTGAQVHCRATVAGFSSDEYVQNCLISMYMNCGSKDEAETVFAQMGSSKNLVSWNTVISGCLQNGFADQAMVIFDRMVSFGEEIDRATVLSVLPACAQLKDLRSGEWIHKLAEENGVASDISVRNALIDMYAKCGRLDTAREIFNVLISEGDVISWTSIIGGYILHGCASEALRLAYQMQFSGIRPNSMTISSLLTACGSLPSLIHGMSFHGFSIKLGIESDIFVETALISMYSNCGETDLSSKMFAASSRITTTWNAFISGFAQKGLAQEATELFKQMLMEGSVPDLITITSMLPAYACSADLQQVNNIHCFLLKAGFVENIEATTCLIDSYIKTGCLSIAWELFDELPVKDVVSWSAIIAGYGKHGNAETAVRLFDQMLQSGVEPNEVTLTSVLNSCSHGGLVDKGLQIFDEVTTVHGLKPTADHYAGIIDLLGRVGRIEEAFALIKMMPFEADCVVWGTLLGACMIHDNAKIGEFAAKRLFEIQPEKTGNYVLLQNIYAAKGRWRDAEVVRRMVGVRGLRKEVACSTVEA